MEPQLNKNPRSDLVSHLELETELIRQEHRFFRILGNFFRSEYLESDPRRGAAKEAFYLRLFFAALPGVTAGGVGFATLIGLIIAHRANGLVGEQNKLLTTQNTKIETQNALIQRQLDTSIEQRYHEVRPFLAFSHFGNEVVLDQTERGQRVKPVGDQPDSETPSNYIGMLVNSGRGAATNVSVRWELNIDSDNDGNGYPIPRQIAAGGKAVFLVLPASLQSANSFADIPRNIKGTVTISYQDIYLEASHKLLK